MSLCRQAEDFFGFPLAVARHAKEPGDQFVALRHRWARRCCRDRTIPFADNSDASTPGRETWPRLEANGINQKGARDDRSREENKLTNQEEWESAPHPSSLQQNWIVKRDGRPAANQRPS